MTKVEITSPTECKTLNPLGEKPDFNYKKFEGKLNDYLKKAKELELWQLEEDKREVYKIVDSKKSFHLFESMSYAPKIKYKLDFTNYIGHIHDAELNKETKTVVIL